MQTIQVGGHHFTSSCPSLSRQREINGLLAGAEFWLSRDDRGRILGNLRLNPVTTNPATVTILLGLLNDKVGRHQVWYVHPRHQWRHICWRGGRYAHFWSLQKRCEESNIDSQRRETIELMQQQWQLEQSPPSPVPTEPQEPERPSMPDIPRESENVWQLRAKAHRAINQMNAEQLRAFFGLVEAAKSPRKSEVPARPSSPPREAKDLSRINTSLERGLSVSNTLPEPEMPTRPSSPRPKEMGKSITCSSPKPA